MKSFLSDRPRVATPALPVEPPPPAFVPAAKRLNACAAASAGVTPAVECVREGDRVARIIVTCACGERVEIDCLYGTGS